jgi:hypothetical protein
MGIAEDRIKGARQELEHERIERFGTDEPDAAHELERQLIEAEAEHPTLVNHIAVSYIRDEAYLERLSRYEQRLELSIHRNLRQLEKLRKQSQSDRDDSGKPPVARCPFLPAKEYAQAREGERTRDRSQERTCETEANDSGAAEQANNAKLVRLQTVAPRPPGAMTSRHATLAQGQEDEPVECSDFTRRAEAFNPSNIMRKPTENQP